MPVYDHSKLNNLIQEIRGGSIFPLFLLIGERYLCQQAADRLSESLCADGGIVHSIDGDSEDYNTTLAKLRSFSLLGGRQVFRVNNSRLFLSKNVTKAIWNRAVKAKEENRRGKATGYLQAMLEAGGLLNNGENNPAGLSSSQWQKHFGFAKPAGKLEWIGELLDQQQEIPSPPRSASGDAGEMLLAALESGLPSNNCLLLLAEEVDKRKKLYKSLSKKYPIINLSVDTGATAKAKKAQQSVLQEQVSQTLQKMGKTMARGVLKQLLERVGFHPVAVVMETEKLALSIGDAPQITLHDLNMMVGRTRQEAVFELTQAIGDGKLDNALLIAARLRENGVHGLAILATLRNFTRTLLLFRSLVEQKQYRFQPTMSASRFQEQCLPLLKENQYWQKELAGHPFALYMKFKTASTFPLSILKSWLCLILAADRRLKGSPLAPDTVIQHLLLSMMTATHDKGNLQNLY
ncbi:MAG: DNA polymerase III subunit delta [Candidatus Electrothrix sp. AR3]|nr:DNA polymerase III subunit delta [Candidatus Electrothrix sp. AR3]